MQLRPNPSRDRNLFILNATKNCIQDPSYQTTDEDKRYLRDLEDALIAFATSFDKYEQMLFPRHTPSGRDDRGQAARLGRLLDELNAPTLAMGPDFDRDRQTNLRVFGRGHPMRHWQDASNQLREFFGYHNDEIRTMNTVRNHSKKCVMALSTSDGSAAWFLRGWNMMPDSEREYFTDEMEYKCHFKEGDFHVHIQDNAERPVIFYLFSILDPLVHKCYTAITRPPVGKYGTAATDSPWRQALNVLHNPSTDTDYYKNFQCEAYDDCANIDPTLLRTTFTTNDR
jgi:hypothetical protein